MCRECDILRAQLAELRDTIKRQKQIIRDLGGPVMENNDDDPYEDEAPLVVWEPKE